MQTEETVSLGLAERTIRQNKVFYMGVFTCPKAIIVTFENRGLPKAIHPYEDARTLQSNIVAKKNKFAKPFSHINTRPR